MQLNANTELQNGKYRIIRVLGQGGFGITYLAENVYFDRLVAIKEFFPKDFCGRDNTSHLTLGTQNNAETVSKLKARFLKEAKNIAKLNHPGIVKIHDVFEENNTAYYVMDYIEGENLNEMVKRTGALPEAKAVEYICKVGEALEYIHAHNMTHFDVKPANIVVRRSDDTPILIDFGLSKQYDIHGEATSTLLQGVSQGYSPIEMYNSGSVSSFSPQTDVYSLGATLYYLVTGKVPPAATDLVETKISLPDNISDKSKKAIIGAMTLPKNLRTKSAQDLIENLPSVGEHKDSSKEDTMVIGGDNLKHPNPGSSSNNLHGVSVGQPSDPDNDGEQIQDTKNSMIVNWVLIPLLSICVIVGIIYWSLENEKQVVDSVPSTNVEAPINPDNIITDFDYVDLGLPSGTKWCTCNYDSNRAYMMGEYYFITKDFTMVYEGEQGSDKFVLKERIPIKVFSEKIAAKNGRIPTKKEFEELKKCCKWDWISYDDLRGYIITGLNNKSIFIPACGYIYNKIWYKGDNGSYWIGDDLEARLCFSKSGIVIDKNLDVPMTLRLVQK